MNKNKRQKENNMTPFLKEVASDLLSRYGTDLSRVAVIFPNKRAALFMGDYFAELSSKPIWSPSYLTINELFLSLSPLEVCDSIEAVCYLYRIYKELAHDAESMDAFYGWGEVILSDFEDVDKNRADASRLFRNLSDIKSIATDYITEEQEKVLSDFFKDFSLENNTELKERFLRLWEIMHELYERLNTALLEKGLAYEGALFRNVIEKLENDEIAMDTYDCYAFVGFNVLDKVEESLFHFLQNKQKAVFYWDYDNYYVNENPHAEAGVFLRRNLSNFPNALEKDCFNNFLSKDKHIEFVAASTENAQARYANEWIKENLTETERDTAVVLCNEALLQSVMSALPSEVEKVNITKGFPITHTPAYTFIEKLWDNADCSAKEGESKMYEKQILLLDEMCEEIKKEAQRLKIEEQGNCEEDFTQQLYSESFYKVYTVLLRFRLLVADNILTVNASSLHRLIRQVLRQTSVPFHGEPAEGLQVMGVLETRLLDFQNILMLSVNETMLPKKTTGSSFIPYNLRKSFSLTTPELKSSVYAYYFYRLLQRASHITLAYNDACDGLVRGEMSRFMQQLLVETSLPIKSYSLASKPAVKYAEPQPIEKPAGLYDIVSRLSPSSLNVYLDCSLRFYYAYVAKLREPDVPLNVMEPNVFGSVFHKAAELIYTKLTEHTPVITAEKLEELTANKGASLNDFIEEAFVAEKAAEQVVVKEVVRMYLLRLLKKDTSLAPFKIVEMEKAHYISINVGNAGGRDVSVGGFIDRMDEVNLEQSDGSRVTTLRVVDYKTGGSPESAKSMEQLITPDDKRPHYVFQTFLYCSTLLSMTKQPIAPALFFVHKAANSDYSPYITFGGKGEIHEEEEVKDFRPLNDEFLEVLKQLLEELYDPKIPFVPTTLEKKCTYCPYSALCREKN